MRHITRSIFSTGCLLATCLTPLAVAENNKARNGNDLVDISKSHYRRLQNGHKSYHPNPKTGLRTFRGIVGEEGRRVTNPRHLNSDGTKIVGEQGRRVITPRHPDSDGTKIVIEDGRRVVNPRHPGSDGTKIVRERGRRVINPRHPGADGTKIVIEDGRRVVNPRHPNGRPITHPGVDWRSHLGVGDDAQLADQQPKVNSAVVDERSGKRRNSSGLLEPLIHRNVVNPRAPIADNNGNRRGNTQRHLGAKPRGWNEVSGKMEPLIARDKINPKNDLQRVRQRGTHISLEQDGIHFRRKK